MFGQLTQRARHHSQWRHDKQGVAIATEDRYRDFLAHSQCLALCALLKMMTLLIKTPTLNSSDCDASHVCIIWRSFIIYLFNILAIWFSLSPFSYSVETA